MGVQRPHISCAGGRGYRAPLGNQLLLDVSRKYHRKRLAMLKSWQNVPHTFFMQIRDAISEKYIFCHILANSAHTSTIKMSNLCFGVESHYKYIIEVISCVHKMLACQVLPPLAKSIFFAIAQPRLKIIAHKKFPRIFWGSKNIIKLFLE